jgi:hypothetical protein
MVQNKLSGTESYFAEPSIDIWREIEAIDDNDLDSFNFDPDTELLTGTIQDPAVLDERIRMDSTTKRCPNNNVRTSQKRTRSATFAEEDQSVDKSIISHTDMSMQSAQLSFMTPVELDHQLEQSMSRLALSMKRSKMSRRHVIQNESSFGGANNSFGLHHQSTLSSDRQIGADNSSVGLSPHIVDYMSHLSHNAM